MLEASWTGNNQFAPSQSGSAALTVTGSALPTPTVLLSSPSTGTAGQRLTLSIMIFNPTNSTLNANATIEITGPNNYVLFDLIQVEVGANLHATGYYDWGVPAQAGAYTVVLSLLSPIPSGADVETIQIT